ncbi:MAG: ABC transporter substrate-binding protein [Acidimicrobiales bacterium]
MRKPSSALRLLAILMALGLFAAACGDSGDDGQADDATTTTAGEVATTAPEDAETTLTTTPPPPPPPVEGPVVGGTLTVGIEADPVGMRPWEDTCSSPCLNVHLAMFDRLFEKNEDLEIAPWLGLSITPDETLTVWTVELREGVTFWDGTPFNAQTVVDMFAIQQTGAVTGSQIATAQVVSVEATDEFTVVYTLGQGNSGFPDVLTSVAGRVFEPAAAAADLDGAASNPMGTGPFQFVSWDRDNQVVLERNPNYWFSDADGTQLPYLDGLVFRPIPDETTRLNAILAGDIDVMQTLRQSTIRDARESSDTLDMDVFQGPNSGGAIFNTAVPPYDDKRVRQGLAHAINQPAFIDALGGTGISDPATQMFSPDSPWYSQEAADAYPKFDPEASIAKLTEYVEDPERSDGKAVGEKIDVEFACPPDPTLILLSQAYKQSWEATGLANVELVQFDQATHIGRVVGAPPDFLGEFQVSCWRVGDDTDPSISVAPFFSPPDVVPLNFTNFFDPEAFGLLVAGQSTLDQAERQAAYAAFSLVLADEMPQVYTGYTATALATLKSVKNLNGWHTPDGDIGRGHPNAEGRYQEVWIENE